MHGCEGRLEVLCIKVKQKCEKLFFQVLEVSCFCSTKVRENTIPLFQDRIEITHRARVNLCVYVIYV